jgi:hypothetical protein
MINIAKDTIRYQSAIKEFEKISFNNFVHLRATYWKERTKMLDDLKMVLSFLSNFNKEIDNEMIKNLCINDFSEVNNPKIKIQDGPLACYVSHLRAMIYGYLNFNDYTIIVEDDVSICNTKKMETYLEQIPNDWGVICMNSMPLNTYYSKPFYKYTDLFHSTHFYIIKNSIMPEIFKNMYPIPDQVDMLIARLNNTINIYNIEDTVYQKNFSTNTQNNLNAIFNGPSYQPIRNYMLSLRNNIQAYIDTILNDNVKVFNNNLKDRNPFIVSSIYSDLIYNTIINNYSYQKSNYNSETKLDVTIVKYENEYTHANDPNFVTKDDFFKNIYYDSYRVINCVVKGKDIHDEAYKLTEKVFRIINSFTLHNTIDLEFNEIMKAYGYGSSSNVYLLEKSKVIVKVYSSYLRWQCPQHNNIDEIFDKEVENLEKLSLLISADKNTKSIKMKYLGESLYDDFNLPNDWKHQLEVHFNLMDSKGIMYPEFNLRNILVLNDKIHLIDYGLSNVNDLSKNDNCTTFIKLIEKINDKYLEIDESDNLFYGDENALLNKQEMKKIYYKTFISNAQFYDTYPGNIF